MLKLEHRAQSFLDLCDFPTQNALDFISRGLQSLFRNDVMLRKPWKVIVVSQWHRRAVTADHEICADLFRNRNTGLNVLDQVNTSHSQSLRMNLALNFTKNKSTRCFEVDNEKISHGDRIHAFKMQLKKNIIIPKKGYFNLTDIIKLTILK